MHFFFPGGVLFGREFLAAPNIELILHCLRFLPLGSRTQLAAVKEGG
jgi:hypothetical protein